jgi:hypothetical protein
MHPEHLWFSLNGGLLGTLSLQILRVYCIAREKKEEENVILGEGLRKNTQHL